MGEDVPEPRSIDEIRAIEREIEALGLTKTDWWVQAAYQMLSSRVLDEASPPKGRSRKREKKSRDDKDRGDPGCHAAT